MQKRHELELWNSEMFEIRNGELLISAAFHLECESGLV
jgi:hypothetical protein